MLQPMRMVMIAATVAVLLMAGCATFLRPEPGTMATSKEERIALAEDRVKGIWAAGEVNVSYSLSCRDGRCSLDGRLVIDRSITDSFPVITSFFFYTSFLDGEGKVLETYDITPVIPAYGHTPSSLPLKMEQQQPEGAKTMVFHYYGDFRGRAGRDGGSWSISHFPFKR
jgi:hypothetical protein